MLTPKPVTIRAVPAPGFIAGCTASMWIESHSPAGRVAFLLIGHAPARRPGETPENIEAGLLGMVDALDLRPPAEHLPDTGSRLVMTGDVITFDYGHPSFTLCLPPTGRAWRSHLADDGPVCVLVGLDPVPPGAGPDAINAYVSRTIATGRVRMGVTRLRKGPYRTS
ncbi:hypothetical protein [Streptomyces daliensis]|uniref:Uncharacterized protein n=1 Tax=Streptomyces daliensis TaxID=299421 RepID=A0A8T4IY87_9ACTN|nr:hypothetical protein [Streptomyces daliensis]